MTVVALPADLWILSRVVAGERQGLVEPSENANAPVIRGTAEIVTDYNRFREGDFEPHLGKNIDTLIFKTQTFIVYLDDKADVQWAFTPGYQLVPGVGAVLNRVSDVQALPVAHLTSEQLTSFRALIAEAVARGLDGDLPAANDAVDKAIRWLDARSTEVARRWYLSASCVTAFCAGLVTMSLWAMKKHAISFGGQTLFEVAMAAGAGAIGALLSILVGAKTVQVDAAASRHLHYLQGGARVVAGSLGAVLVALGVKGQLFMTVTLSTANPFASLLTLCMIAGSSERLVPSFIQNVEIAASTTKNSEKRKGR